MTDEIIASVPLGLVVGIGLLLVLAGFLMGWISARRKNKNGPPPSSPDRSVLVQFYSQPVLLLDSTGAILVQNARAHQILTELGAAHGIPQSISQALSRSLSSGSIETIDLPSPGAENRRLQAQITPLNAGSLKAEALVEFIESKQTGRGNVSQQLPKALAHELRTPLTAVMGHLEILNDCKYEEEALWRRSLGFVISETERLARLVEDILHLSRFERVPLYLQGVNLRFAVEEVISTLSEDAEKANAKVVLKSSEDLPFALADSDRIRQVFINLIENAIKYAPGSTITVSLSAAKSLIDVSIHDTGPGIAQDDLPHIFEPFYRRGQTKTRERGSGLGLTIVQTILEQHHSPIQTHSTPEEGTTFAFSLPINHQKHLDPI